MSVRFSQNLERSLERAFDVASQQRRRFATPEDLLVALTEDPDASAVMQGLRIDAERLRRELTAYMDGAVDESDADTADVDASAPARPTPELQSIIHVVVAHAQSIGRDTVTGVDVLIALLPEAAGHFLQQQGMTRYTATRYISHGIVDGEPQAGEAGLPAGSPAEVRMLNDDYTPMEFVVHILEQVFGMDHDTAVRTMLHIHNSGISRCGTFPADVARAKVAEVLAAAREHGHPLQCVLVQQPSPAGGG